MTVGHRIEDRSAPVAPPQWAVQQMPESGDRRRQQELYAATLLIVLLVGSPPHPSTLPLNGLRDIRRESPNLQINGHLSHQLPEITVISVLELQPHLRVHFSVSRMHQGGVNEDADMPFRSTLLFRNAENNRGPGVNSDVFGPTAAAAIPPPNQTHQNDAPSRPLAQPPLPRAR
ncbi:hypothetical protein R3P38DRAFT_2772221 [Favolaschia claudopus]|uniref:Uncharacterized protein n=1 Tax=Favolaschia claudopus TaxID=2862362 RepID=A0AAW0C642_9AGAR